MKCSGDRDLWSSLQVMHSAAACSATPPTCHAQLVQHVNVDAPSTAPLSNSVVETSPLLFTLEAPPLRAAATAAESCVAAALHAAEEHARSCAPLCSVLREARSVRGDALERAYEMGELDIDGLRSVFERLEAFHRIVDSIQVCP